MENSERNSGDLIPQSHGGALLPGGKRGNAGGGRPRDAIREAYVNVLTEHGVAFIRDVVEGRVVTPLPEGCEHCGHEPTNGSVVETHALRMAPSVDARLRAIDIANRYGLGGRDEITVVSADVQQRLA